MIMFSTKPNKTSFLTFDFYAQVFFSAIALLLAFLSIFDALFAAIGLWFIVPVALYNSVGLLIHIFEGSYSKNIIVFRIIHAILGFTSIIGILFYLKDNLINEGMVFYLICGIPFIFLITYFLITWQDFKTMKETQNRTKV